MNGRKAGIIFLAQIVLSIGASLLVQAAEPLFQLPVLLNLCLSQLLVLIPAVAVALLSREPAGELLSIRPFSLKALLLIPVVLVLSEPITMTCNAFSMMFTENEAQALGEMIIDLPMGLMVLVVGVLGPVSEEVVFRGILFSGLKRSGRVLPAILLQALLFGLIHLNLNQFCYAFALGMIMGLLVEATGSLLASIAFHVLINAPEVLAMYRLDDLTEISSQELTQESLMLLVCICGIASVFAVILLGCLLYGIASLEGRREYFGGIFTRDLKEKRGSVWSVWTVIGVALAAVLILLETICSVLLS